MFQTIQSLLECELHARKDIPVTACNLVRDHPADRDWHNCQPGAEQNGDMSNRGNTKNREASNRSSCGRCPTPFEP